MRSEAGLAHISRAMEDAAHGWRPSRARSTRGGPSLAAPPLHPRADTLIARSDRDGGDVERRDSAAGSTYFAPAISHGSKRNADLR